MMDWYRGIPGEPGRRGKELPPSRGESTPSEVGQRYVASDAVRRAVNVALALGQPLLVTGEPGTGKTLLASSVAYDLGLDLLTFTAKTTSTARDLFYYYDALGHFRAAQTSRDAPAKDYIQKQALGEAIEKSMRQKQRTVVLIDEIDKAPRDFPNDVLAELEGMSFGIPETGETFSAAKDHKPVVILTSNQEKNLPDAFLRRCVFHHIEFPSAEQLREIVARHTGVAEPLLSAAVENFRRVREFRLGKRPATAELIEWVAILERLGVTPETLLEEKPLSGAQADLLLVSYGLLLKTKDDVERVKQGLR